MTIDRPEALRASQHEPPAVGGETRGVVLGHGQGQRLLLSAPVEGQDGRRRSGARRAVEEDERAPGGDVELTEPEGPVHGRRSLKSRQRAPSPTGESDRTEPRRPRLRERRPDVRLRIGRSSRLRGRSSAFRWPGRRRRCSRPRVSLKSLPLPKREQDSCPTGENLGKQMRVLPREESSCVSFASSPPASGTTSRDPLIFRVTTIRPSSPQLAPTGIGGIAESETAVPPESGTFLSSARVKKPTHWPSGEKNGEEASLGPLDELRGAAAQGAPEQRRLPPWWMPWKTTVWPSGEMARRGTKDAERSRRREAAERRGRPSGRASAARVARRRSSGAPRAPPRAALRRLPSETPAQGRRTAGAGRAPGAGRPAPPRSRSARRRCRGGGASGPSGGSGAEDRGRGGRSPAGARPVGLRPQDRRERVGHGLARERLPARQALVEHAAEGEDVGPLVQRLSAGLLGAHVGGGSEDRRRRASPES